jgi:hypothetical protein
LTFAQLREEEDAARVGGRFERELRELVDIFAQLFA